MSTIIQSIGTPQVQTETKFKKKIQLVQKTPNFKTKTINDEFVKTYEVKATSDKKWIVGLASTFLSGLGQAINGEWTKGFAYMISTYALAVAGHVARTKSKPILEAGCISSALTLNIFSIVDAVKNVKTTVHVIYKEKVHDEI